MPLFSKTHFRSGKKPVKRKSVSLSNISSLDESVYSVNDLKLESGPLTLRLGEHELMFNKGQWISSSKDGPVLGSTDLQQEHKQVMEENNLLKFKIELLLDMLAASNADNYVLQKELESLKKQSKKH